MQWLTLALGIASGLGIGSWISGRWERNHAAAEARSTRRFQIRLDAYKQASTWLERQRLWVQLTEPIRTPAPEPPDVIDDAVEFAGTIAVTASDEVQTAMRTAVDAILVFEDAVAQYRRSKNAGDAMQKARERAVSAIEHAQSVMRNELADL